MQLDNTVLRGLQAVTSMQRRVRPSAVLCRSSLSWWQPRSRQRRTWQRRCRPPRHAHASLTPPPLVCPSGAPLSALQGSIVLHCTLCANALLARSAPPDIVGVLLSAFQCP